MKKQSTFKMVLVALYVAIIFVLNSTPLGYIHTPSGFTITTVFLPVIFAAITLGPTFGGILGFTFGMTSFLQCFGNDALAASLFAENPYLYAVMCFVPRIIMGIAVGLIFKGLKKIDKTKFLSYAIASVSAVILNTVLFLTAFNLFFSGTAFSGATVKAILSSVIALNGIVEMVVALVVGTVVSKALVTAIKKLR